MTRQTITRLVCCVACCAALVVFGTPRRAAAITPDDPGAGDVLFSINSGSGVQSISPYIYGMNSFFNGLPTGADSGPAIALDRLGGNRWTGYNWETNHSNAGSDYFHVNDGYLVNYQGNTAPGAAVAPSLASAATHDRGVLVTVPIAGYVSADNGGTVEEADVAPSSRWKSVVAKKSTVYPGSSLSLAPNESDGYVFTDEYVNWVESNKAPGTEVFYGLDNEPGLWDSTHPRLHPGDPTFAELRDKGIAHAGAIKDVAPDALVFGPTAFGWSAFQNLQSAPDATGSPSHPGNADLDFLEWYLNEIRQEETAQGRTLVDVLDLHWYPEARSGTDPNGGTRITFDGVDDNTPAVVDARVQAARSLWDPTYTENSWISEYSTNGPVDLLGRVQADIDTFKPGTKLAITEYNYGGGDHISGAIAQADVLGIFGREELFAATWWNLDGGDADAAPFTYAAFDMYRNYDGEGGAFGDTSVDAQTDDLDTTAVYASVDSEDPSRMVLVAINRTGEAQDVAIAIEHDRAFGHAEVYELMTGGGQPVISQQDDIELSLLNAFHYTLPAWGVATLVLVAEEDLLAGDYNGDGLVDAADYTVWRDALGSPAGTLPNDVDGGAIGAAQYATWAANYGSAAAGVALARVPEPAAALLMALALVFRSRTASRP